jgi:hypothetical protein
MKSRCNTNTPRDSSFSGLDIFHDCQQDLTILVALKPFYENTQDVLVTLSIGGWDKNVCSKLQINFPGTTYNHEYFIDAGYAIEAGVDPQTALSKEYTRRKIENLEVNHDWTNQDIISFPPNEQKDFSGGVEFIWIQGMEKTSFSESSLLLPFGAINSGETTLKSIDKFEISVQTPDGHKLTAYEPEHTGYKPFGNISFYNFSIEGNRTPLILKFQNPALENNKEIMIMFLSTLFGIGLGKSMDLLTESLHKNKAG